MATIITITLSAALTGGDGIAAAVEEYSGLNTSVGAAAVDVKIATSGTSFGPASGNTANTAAANELVFGAGGDDGGNTTYSGANGMTKHSSIESSALAEIAVGDKDSGAIGARSADFTTVGSVAWDCVCVVYVNAAGWARVAGASNSAVSAANPSTLQVSALGTQTANNRLIMGIEFNGTNASFPTSSITDDSSSSANWRLDHFNQSTDGTFTKRVEVWSKPISAAAVVATPSGGIRVVRQAVNRLASFFRRLMMQVA